MRRVKNSQAFSMLELIAVLVTLGILAAVGLFGYQKFVNSGSDTDARERLLAVAAVQAEIAAEWGRYTAFPDDVGRVSGGSKTTRDASTGPDRVSVYLADNGWLGMAVESNTGECFYMRLQPLLLGGDTQSVDASGVCSGAVAVDNAPESAASNVSVRG